MKQDISHNKSHNIANKTGKLSESNSFIPCESNDDQRE